MSLIIQIIFVIFGAFLSVVLTKFLIQNGKAIGEEGKHTRELIEKISDKMDEGFRLIGSLIAAESDETRRKTIDELRKVK